jgi:hypothetical protein
MVDDASLQRYRSIATRLRRLCANSVKSGRDAGLPCFACRMWLGLLYDACNEIRPGVSDEDTVEEPGMVILYAWGAGGDRPMSIAGTASTAADSARALRDAGWGTTLKTPRCDACGTPFDLPLE